MAADPSSPKLGSLDCDLQGVLCNAWAAAVPTLWHIDVPQAPPAGQERPKAPLYVVGLNRTTVTAQSIYKIHSEKSYLSVPEYTGAVHPLDGWIVKYGFVHPFAWIMWAFGAIPSWAFMIGVSLISRTVMYLRLHQFSRDTDMT